jgi:hypothetical protein
MLSEEDRKRLLGIARTKAAPTVQQANPTRAPKKSPNAMSLDTFMKRNPSARDLDGERASRKKAIEGAQRNQGQRSNRGGRPNIRETDAMKKRAADKAAKEAGEYFSSLPDSTKALMNNPILSAEVKKHLK